MLAEARPELHRRMRPLLGCYVEIAAMGVERGRAMAAIDAAFARIAQLQAQMSLFHADSALSQLNLSEGQWCKLPHDTLRVLQLARAMMRISGGKFNCTVGGTLLQQQRLPRLCEQEFLLSGNVDDIEIKSGCARLIRPVYITLDGIAKGYAVDKALAVLRKFDINTAWVNAGGDLRVIGEIELPIWLRDGNGQQYAVGQLRNAAMASSQTRQSKDENFPGLLVGASKFDHNETITVLSRSAWCADALTKVAALSDVTERSVLIARCHGRYLDPSLCVI